VLGLQSGRTTQGHRFLSSGEIVIDHPDEYVARLAAGKVIADLLRNGGQRSPHSSTPLPASSAARINPADGLLDEVTALVEWPVVYVGEFEAEYLEVPQECLILTMQQNQKYFPLLDRPGQAAQQVPDRLQHAGRRPGHIIRGNERVVRPPLGRPLLLRPGPQERLCHSRHVSRLGGLSPQARLARRPRAANGAHRAQHRRKTRCRRQPRRARGAVRQDRPADRHGGRVPELQGIMGRYYLLHEGGLPVVADAIEQHYRPRFAGDALPVGNIACAAALADKLDSLVGFFGIGQLPTGDKDPFGLRRAALGVLRILMETPLPLDLGELIGTRRRRWPDRESSSPRSTNPCSPSSSTVCAAS
jgi:glycyl-tRNA synthetase beta chain